MLCQKVGAMTLVLAGVEEVQEMLRAIGEV